MKNKFITVCLIIGSLFISGCASMKRSILTGVGIGAATGAITGAGVQPENRRSGAVTGGIIGAVIGGAGLYAIHSFLGKRDTKTRRQTLLNLDKFSVSTPSKRSEVQDFKLSAPDVNKECFGWEIKGNKLVQQHCVWSIQGNSFWTPTSK